ncbi:MAG: DUF134 domain-containing protein [Tenericutes bacterium]|nr:DUF134 domain-containing protein [Mycoplasmatota bacterium]
MPRPTKMRNVSELPLYCRFGPLDKRNDLDIIIMSIDEYETIRLIDESNYDQSECAIEMGIGRTTAQRIYNRARKKISLCLVYGKTLQIEGGEYFIKGQGQGQGRGQGLGRGQGRGKHQKGIGRNRKQ